MIYNRDIQRIHLLSRSLQGFMTSKGANLKYNILFLKKNDKYVLDVHCSVRIRIDDEDDVEPKPLFLFFSWPSFCANLFKGCTNCAPYGNTAADTCFTCDLVQSATLKSAQYLLLWVKVNPLEGGQCSDL